MSKANLADGWCPEQDRRVSDCVRLFAPCCSQPFQKKNWTRFSSIFYILVTYRATNWEVILDSGCGQKISNWWEKNFRARAYAEHANRYLFYVLCTTLGERGLLRRSEKGKKRTCLRRLTISTAWTPGRSYLTPACTCDRGTLRLFIEPANWLLGVHKGI